MTWSGYWGPQLTSWIVGGALSAAVAVLVGFLLRRWARRYLGAWLDRVFAISEEAAKHSADAKTAAEKSVKETTRATDANANMHDAVVQLAEQNGRAIARAEDGLRLAQQGIDLAKHVSELLDTRVLRLEEQHAAAEIRRRHREREGVPE